MVPDVDPLSVPIEDTSARSVACGVDVVSIERIEQLLDEFEESFRNRVFAPAEQRYCERRGDPPQHYAARWAVKEAFIKAVDAESPPIPFQSVAVDKRDEEPTLRLQGAAETALAVTTGDDPGATTSSETAVSLSHDRHADRAIGQVVLTWCP